MTSLKEFIAQHWDEFGALDSTNRELVEGFIKELEQHMATPPKPEDIPKGQAIGYVYGRGQTLDEVLRFLRGTEK